jgi:hypothetical protein
MSAPHTSHDFVGRFHLKHWLVALLGAMLLLAVWSSAASSEASKAPSEPAATTQSADAQKPESGIAEPSPSKRSPRHKLSPMFIEMRAVLDAERTELATLRARFAETTDPSTALDLQRSIEKLKANTEIALLRIQATHARKAGRLELATRIDSAIQRILAPPLRLEPMKRPTPTDATKASER